MGILNTKLPEVVGEVFVLSSVAVVRVFDDRVLVEDIVDTVFVRFLGGCNGVRDETP